jgi:hypothetical protein
MRTFQVLRAEHKKQQLSVPSTMRCYGSRPSQAALKASTKLCSENKIRSVTLTIQEISPHSKHKMFTYKCTRKKKKTPTTISNGVRFAYAMTCTSLPSPKALYGGGKRGENYSVVCHGCIEKRKARAITVPENMEIHFYTKFGECLMVSTLSAAEICQFVNEKGIVHTFFTGDTIPNFTLASVRQDSSPQNTFTGNSTITICTIPNDNIVGQFNLFQGSETTTTLKALLTKIGQDFRTRMQKERRVSCTKIHVHCLFCAVTCDRTALPEWIKEIQNNKMDIDVSEDTVLQFTGRRGSFFLH